MAERFKIRNRAHEPSGAAKRLAGFTTHPELGGRVLAPRATRFVLSSELTARLLDDVEKYQACGVVSFQAEFGRPVEVDVPALRTRLGLSAALALPEPTPPRGVPAVAIFVDELPHFEVGADTDDAAPPAPAPPAPEKKEKAPKDEKPEKVREEKEDKEEKKDAEPEEAPPETPEEGTATLADSFLEDVPRDAEEPAVKVFTEEELSALTGAKLDEILVGTFKHDPKQLYKIGNKAKKVEHILALQAGTATE